MLYAQMAAAVAAPVQNEPTAAAAVRFPLLDPAVSYNPNTFDYNSTTPGQPSRVDWIRVFR